jgi:hypothetical protein
MNFNELMTKLSEIEGSGTVPHDSTASPLSHVDAEIEECGMPGMSNMPSGMMGMREEPPKQADSVTMNVSMNGSGAGGIRDLMSLLRNIEDGGAEDAMPTVLSIDEPEMGIAIGGDDEHEHGHDDHKKLLGDVGEEYANEPDEMYSGVSASVHNGADLNRSKRGFAAAQPGDNAMATESLKAQLKNLYTEVKNR